MNVDLNVPMDGNAPVFINRFNFQVFSLIFHFIFASLFEITKEIISIASIQIIRLH